MIGALFGIALILIAGFLLYRQPKPKSLRMSAQWKQDRVEEEQRQNSKGFSLR